MIGGVGGLETELWIHSLWGSNYLRLVIKHNLYTKTKCDIDGHLFAQ